MYGWIDQEASRQHREEIRNEVAANRLAKVARANRVRAGATPPGKKDQQAILISSLNPGDEARLLGMYSRLSLRSIYRRFHTPFPRVPEWLVVSFAKADQNHMVGVVAIAGEEIVGHAMYARPEDSDEAEFAIVVEDRWQSKGVGKLLLSELAREAMRQGVETFTGIVLTENRPAFGLIDAVFAGAKRSLRDGSYDVCAPLQSLKSLTILKPLASIRP